MVSLSPDPLPLTPLPGTLLIGGRRPRGTVNPSAPISNILGRLRDVRGSDGRFTAFCPAHSDRRERSLSISEGDDGRVLVKCHAGCDFDAIRQALGVDAGAFFKAKSIPTPESAPRKVSRTTRYPIVDAEGATVAEHVREDGANGSKKVWWCRDGKNGLGGLSVEDLPLYGLPRLLSAQEHRRVVVTEGEKAADALNDAGILAVGTVTGAASVPTPAVLASLRDRDVCLWPDADDVGVAHMNKVAARMLEAGLPAPRIIAWRDAPLHGDAVDYLETDGTGGIEALWETAVDYTPASPATPPLDEVRAFIGHYIVATSHQLDAVTLWLAHAHAIEAAETTPYLSIRSAEKRSGKSRLLEVLELLVPEPLKTENISVAALARTADGGATLLLDEVDSVFGKGSKASETQEMLRGVLDSGYRVSGSYVRMVGPGANMSPRRFNTFGAKALSGIGTLPGTLDDRSIIVVLKRKTKDEQVSRFRYRDARDSAKPLQESLVAWALSAVPQLRDARPDIPAALDDRAQDGWEPLLAIADIAGGDWPQRARDAARALSSGETREDESQGVRLLDDIHGILMNRDRISSDELVRCLAKLDEAPWGDWHGKPLSQRTLAPLLKPYGIRPRSVRQDDGSTPKGYRTSDFEDAFSRYLPLQTATSATPHDDGVQSPNLPATPTPLVADRNGPGTPVTQRVADVADRNGGERDEDDVQESTWTG